MKIRPSRSFTQFRFITSGHYIVEIIGVEDREVRGAKYLYWKLRILGTSLENMGTHDLYGVNLIHNVPIEGRHVWRLDMLLKAVNPEYNGGEFDTADYIGKKLEVKVSTHRNDGKRREYPNIDQCFPFVEDLLEPHQVEHHHQQPELSK